MGIIQRLFGKHKQGEVSSKEQDRCSRCGFLLVNCDCKPKVTQEARLRQEAADAPRDLKLAKQIEISGDWTKSFWKDLPVRVYSEPDAVAPFFSQATLPYLWPDIEEYKQHVDSQGDAQRRIRLSWIVAYLHHPHADVLLKTLRDHIPADLLGTLAINDALADLLTQPILSQTRSEVCSEAAKVIWTCSDASLRQIFTILSSQGTLPSGIRPPDARRAVEILRDSCPPSRRQVFGELALGGFGPTLAGVEWDLKPGVISFKERVAKPGAFGTTSVYEVYVGRSKMDALKFLEGKEATQDNYFIVVETPEGNWAKDRMGMYEEPPQKKPSKGSVGERSGGSTVSIGDTNVGFKVVAVKKGAMGDRSIVLAERVSDAAPTKYVVWYFSHGAGGGFTCGTYENDKAEAQRVFDARE